MRKWPRGLCVLVTVACTTEVPATVTEGSVRQFTGGADVWKRPQVFVLVVDDGPAAESASLRAELAARLRKGALEDAMNAGPAWDADWMPAESTLLLVEPTAPPKFHSIPYRTARQTHEAAAAWGERVAVAVEGIVGRTGGYPLLKATDDTLRLVRRERPVASDDEAAAMIDVLRDAEVQATMATARDDASEAAPETYAFASYPTPMLLVGSASMPRLDAWSGPPRGSATRLADASFLFDISFGDGSGLAVPAWVRSGDQCVLHLSLPDLFNCDASRGWGDPTAKETLPASSWTDGKHCVVERLRGDDEARCAGGQPVDRPGFCILPSAKGPPRIRLARDAAPFEVRRARLTAVCNAP